MPPPIGDQIINNITKSDKGLDFHYEMSFGSQTFKITMSLALKDGKLSGTIADEDGLFELPATGVKKGTKDPSGTGRIQRRPRMGPTVEYYKVGGKKIAVSYGSPSINAPGFNRVPNTQTDGFIWQMGRDAATKIQTDADLLFGDRLIKAGRYGLWAKKVDGGWHLLINAKPDVWGTQHDPDADLAEVPMSLSKLDAPVENLKIEFLEENGAGVFRLTWGTDELKAQFRISQ
ncbi:DUF2911 domain-containing protein [Candidatus Sumerlaeota bacterium]|nr:DUF2911 domain-containing protein [Candidatus Sumerlaeota bacterium]